MFEVLFVHAQVQIALHVADHQHDLNEKTDLVMIGHFVDVAQNVTHLSWEVSDEQSSR